MAVTNNERVNLSVALLEFRCLQNRKGLKHNLLYVSSGGSLLGRYSVPLETNPRSRSSVQVVLTYISKFKVWGLRR